MSDLARLATEGRNPRTTDLDTMALGELLAVMNEADQSVPEAVRAVLPAVAAAVELCVRALAGSGRVVYLGAGTSGRLGVLDAAECPPTFGTAPERVVGLVAGGPAAVLAAVEGAEDDPAAGAADLERIGVGATDVVVGLAASGRTPYVLGGLEHARDAGAATVAVACVAGAAIGALADVTIEVDTGPEIVTGSTRLKAGSAQKLVLNMLSTATMVRLGKTYENLMVDVRPSNAKLDDRVRRIVAEATGEDATAVQDALRAAGGSAKTAIVMLLTGTDADRAAGLLRRADGHVRAAIRLGD